MLLVGAVAAIMVAGMVLKSSDLKEALRPVSVSAGPAPSLPLGATITPQLSSEASTETASPLSTPLTLEAEPRLVALALRAATDCGRLEKARGRWTAQLVVACKPETVDRLLGAARGSTEIFVLPARVKDDACFRVCFGAYATSKEAARAADLPNTLRGNEKILAVEIAKVLP